MTQSDSFDVVVLGSGAAGMTAAFTAANEGATVALFEKHERVGGTSAWSGGHVWVPANTHMADDHGLDDSVEEGVEYLLALGRGLAEEPLVRAFAENGTRMISYLEEHADIPFLSVAGLPDYHPEHPGGKPTGGRTLGTHLFPFAELGEWRDRVEVTPYYSPYFRMDETGIGAGVPTPPSAEELARRQAADERGQGGSLIGLLLRAVLRAGVHVETSAGGVDLLIEDGRVVGVELDGAEGRRTVRANRGVILATGGFEWHEEYRRTFLRGPALPASIPTNTGDGLTMSIKAGAALQNMREAWWIPIAHLPEGINSMNLDMINADRTRPGSIMVNREGRRFANEAANYNAFGGAFHQEDVAAFGYANIPAWVIHDHAYLVKYGSRGTPFAGQTPPWLTEAPTLRSLAEIIGVDPDGLDNTVARWNDNAVAGIDPDFHRGESAHDLWWGDPYNKGVPQATLGPLTQGPFYALELGPGMIGTKGGPKVDTNSQVVDLAGEVIPGLYAVGNTSSPTGTGYGGPGGTLGPNMTFAWLAGRHAAG